jgi:dihydrofolate reductase
MAEPARSIDGIEIAGLAIVSDDGMIADAHGAQPPSLLLEADQRFFRGMLDEADVIVHGRYSAEGGPGADRRRRIVLSRRPAAVERDPANPLAVLWNPSGAALHDALAAIAPPRRRLAVIGGTDVFGAFLEIGYDFFYLSRASRVRLPGGRPVFPGIPPHSPEELLSRHGLGPQSSRVLDAAAGLTLTTWRRHN